MNPLNNVKYAINRASVFAFLSLTLLLNSREMDRNNRVDPLYLANWYEARLCERSRLDPQC